MIFKILLFCVCVFCSNVFHSFNVSLYKVQKINPDYFVKWIKNNTFFHSTSHIPQTRCFTSFFCPRLISISLSLFLAAIDVLNNIGRADGKRSLWKTDKTEAKYSFILLNESIHLNLCNLFMSPVLFLRHEGEMYKTLLSDYDSRQRALVLENAELRKVLQQMKKEIVSLLVSSKLKLTGDKQEETTTQVRQDVFFPFPLSYKWAIYQHKKISTRWQQWFTAVCKAQTWVWQKTEKYGLLYDLLGSATKFIRLRLNVLYLV